MLIHYREEFEEKYYPGTDRDKNQHISTVLKLIIVSFNNVIPHTFKAPLQYCSCLS